jgi:hypothetical protein
MVAPRQIRCMVVEVDAEEGRMSGLSASRIRPSDLLPWADPYIAGLVRKMQEEVRQETGRGTTAAAGSQLKLDLSRLDAVGQ